jgi:ribosome-binding protein aMBF1 (putative translation factor)
MSTTNPDSFEDTCIVCGKDTSGDRGFMHLNIDGQLIELCCPQCYKVYQEEPARYLSRQTARRIERQLDPGKGA